MALWASEDDPRNPRFSSPPRQVGGRRARFPLRQFVTEAVQEKLRIAPHEKPWTKHLGKLKHLRKDKDRKQIERRVEQAFEQIDRELWR